MAAGGIEALFLKALSPSEREQPTNTAVGVEVIGVFPDHRNGAPL